MSLREPTISQTPTDAQAGPPSFDLIVVGAGINGTGIARDAAMRGLKVLLLDREDAAAGTSSRSGRMIHGGLRYLEHAEIGLVRESLRERATLLSIAPHLVRPRPLLIPVHEGGRRRPWQVRLGLRILDFFAPSFPMGRNLALTRDEMLERVPGLKPEGLAGGGAMQDAYAELAERLCVENVLSARAHGATFLNHVRVTRLVVEGGAVRGVDGVDELDGRRTSARAPVVVNAAGPWVDSVLAGAGVPFPRLIGGTLGGFIIVDPFPGAPRENLFCEAAADCRPLGVLPWNGHILIGTTDRRYDGDPGEAEAGGADVEYLLRETNRLFPGAALTAASIRFTYAGVRPLPYVATGPESAITRRHILHDHAPAAAGLVSVVGGKLSTFRALAEEATDLVFRKLGRKPPPCATASRPLPGAETADFEDFTRRFAGRRDVPPALAGRLLRVYGVRAEKVIGIAAAGGPDLLDPLGPGTDAVGAEVVLAFRDESARTLVDALRRRLLVGWDADLGLGSVEGAARVARRHLGWDDARAEAEVAAYRAYIRRFHPRGSPGSHVQDPRSGITVP